MTKESYTCCLCSSSWQKKSATHCWSSDPSARPKKPAYCPTTKQEDKIRKAMQHYRGTGEDARIAQTATRVEGLCYQSSPGSNSVNARWTRVEDTIAFAKLMDYSKIGIATCIGLLDETDRLAKILDAQGLTPLSVCCKTGSIDKAELGISEEEKVRPKTFEPLCNPVAQAMLLNSAKTDMNIIVGLCVGHDMLFTKYSKAPVTTLVVKDRVTGHNPVSVLYGQNFYYKRLQAVPLRPEKDAGP